MAQRPISCGCGALVSPNVALCPMCGARVGSRDDAVGRVRVQEDLGEPIRPVPRRSPWYPLILLGSAGLLIAAVLVGLILYFGSRQRALPAATPQPARAPRRVKDEEPLISIREIPSLKPAPHLPDERVAAILFVLTRSIWLP
ncbi:MAG TPA: hypothetical protein VE981_01930 [Planctomycetota bacterium]|nr:hypothetical protein [Planctomycetota bacterium]